MTGPRAERRLAAILAADVVGYSHLIEQDEAGTLAALKDLRHEVIDPLLAEYRGRIVKLMGDGAIVEFGSVVDAVSCAHAMQKGVADYEKDRPAERRIIFRIGINLGDVVVDGGDLMGDGVNVAARLEQIGPPGGVMISGTAYDHLQGKLDLPIAFAGEQRVKNIDRPIRTYEIRAVGKQPTARRFVGRLRRWAPAVAMILLLLGLAGGLASWLRSSGSIPRVRPAIAVLPFDNLSGDGATGRLADGITEDIITDLSRFKDLDVIARNSTGAYKGRSVDVREVGRALNVTYVLEGSIQRQGDQLRVTAQLVNSADGSHLWSQRWDRPAQDVFAVQSELAERVAGSLAAYGVITDAEIAVAKRKRPENLSAYDFYMLGTEARHRQTKEGVEEGIQLLTRAVEMDPGLARAWVGLAWARGWTQHFGADPETARRGREEAARRALELDPSDAEAHVAMTVALGAAGKFSQAEAELDKALSLGPSNTVVLVVSAEWASPFGRPEKGAEMADRMIRLDPSYPRWAATAFQFAYFMAGRYEDALRVIDRIPPETLRKSDFIGRAAALGALGRVEQVQAATAETLARFPDLSIESYVIFSPGWSDAERQRLVETMRKAGFPACAKNAPPLNSNTQRLPECVSG